MKNNKVTKQALKLCTVKNVGVFFSLCTVQTKHAVSFQCVFDLTVELVEAIKEGGTRQVKVAVISETSCS